MSDPLFLPPVSQSGSLSVRLSMSKGGRGTSDRIDGARKFYTSTPGARLRLLRQTGRVTHSTAILH